MRPLRTLKRFLSDPTGKEFSKITSIRLLVKLGILEYVTVRMLLATDNKNLDSAGEIVRNFIIVDNIKC